jgi:hypothetical protein
MSNVRDDRSLSENATQLLTEVAEMLSFDGYNLGVSVVANEVGVIITAGPDACEECLVPKSLMEQIIRDALIKGSPEWAQSVIAISYPVDVPEH